MVNHRITPSPRPRRTGQAHWTVLAFMLGFTILLVAISWYYLFPAFDAAKAADQSGKHKLAATSSLLLAVVLFVLISGILMTFRVGRFFFPRPTPKRTQTQYIDAWSESAKRLQPDPDPDDDD